jgi:hypothetical protein
MAGELRTPSPGALELALRERALVVLDQEALTAQHLMPAAPKAPRDAARSGTGDGGRPVKANVKGGRQRAVGQVVQPPT